MRRIKQIAKRVRAYCVKNWYDHELGGMCGRASVMLHRALKRAGFRTNIVCNDSHAFLEYGDLIIDITGSQFGQEDVMIVPKSEMYQGYWKIVERFKTDKEFIAYQLEVDWPSEQIFGRRY